MKVLLVDDEREILESLQEFFVDEGFEVDAAANGAEALEKLEQAAPPNVVVLDLMMPLVNGLQVYQRIQADPRWARIPVIISTSDPSRAPSGLLIMKKPIDLEALLKAVRGLGQTPQ